MAKMGSSTLHRHSSSNEGPKSLKNRRICLLIALIVAFDSRVKAAPFGRPTGTFRQKGTTSIPEGAPSQLEDVRRRYPLLLRKILGQIRGGSDDESQALGTDEIGGSGSAKRRRRRRRKTRSHGPEGGDEQPEDISTAAAADADASEPVAATAGDDEGSTVEGQGEDGASKSWLESYLSGAGGADDEAGDNENADGAPGNDAAGARVTAADDADTESYSTPELLQTHNDVDSGPGETTESENVGAEDTQQTGHRRRRRRRRRGATTTTTASAEESKADLHEADIAGVEDEQTGEEEPGSQTIIPVEASDEVSAIEVDPAAESGDRVKMRRRRRRRTRANTGTHQPEIVGEEELAPSVDENDQGDDSDGSVSESLAEANKSSDLPDDGDNEISDTDILSAADIEAVDQSIPTPNLTADPEISPEVEVTSLSEDTKEESDGSSAEIADEEVEEEATVSDYDDDETEGESSDEESNGSQQGIEDEDSSNNISDQSDGGADDSGEDADAGPSEASASSEDKDTDSQTQNATPDGASDDSPAIDEPSDVESDSEEIKKDETENEEADGDASKEEEEERGEISEGDEGGTEEVEDHLTSEAESSPAEDISSDDNGSSSDNDEDESSDAEAPIVADVLEATEVEEEEEVDEDTNLAADETHQESTEAADPDLEISYVGSTERARDEVNLDIESVGVNEEEVEDDDSTKITVSVVTWNLAEASPSEDEARFIRRFRKAHPSLSPQEDRKGSDIILIGGQETEDIKPRRAEGNRSRELRRLMIKMLGTEYVPIAIHSLGGVQFGLCVRREILGEIEICRVADVTCGIGNVFHNKGAICAYVQIKARSKQGNEGEGDEESSTRRQKSVKMLFVAAHMAAHVKNVDARNEDFWRIASEFEAQAPPRFLRPKSPKEQALVDAEESGGSYLMDSMDHVFFCGDLNYRIDLPREITEYTVMKIEECLQRGEERKADKLRLSLLRHDQLSRVMSEGAAFPGFAEGKITFPPTFKFDKGTKSYDTSHKQRVPAFTDRILFKPSGVRVLEYRSEVDATHSDHRPVSGTFLVDIEGKKLSEQSRRQKPKNRSRRKRPRPDVDR